MSVDQVQSSFPGPSLPGLTGAPELSGSEELGDSLRSTVHSWQGPASLLIPR